MVGSGSWGPQLQQLHETWQQEQWRVLCGCGACWGLQQHHQIQRQKTGEGEWWQELVLCTYSSVEAESRLMPKTELVPVVGLCQLWAHR